MNTPDNAPSTEVLTLDESRVTSFWIKQAPAAPIPQRLIRRVVTDVISGAFYVSYEQAVTP